MGDSDATRRAFLKGICGVAASGLGASLGGCDGAGGQAETAAPDLGADASAIAKLLDAQPALFRPTDRGCTVQWVARQELTARVTRLGPYADPPQLLPMRA